METLGAHRSVPSSHQHVEARNLPVVNESEASPEVERLYQEFRESFGRPQVPGILKCFATHPALLKHMLGLAQEMLFSDGALNRRQKELIATFVSARNACVYCADSHGASLRMQGGSVEMLEGALSCDADARSLSPSESALLSFVLKVTDDSASLNPSDTGAMRMAGWNDLQIAETIHMAALFACFNRVVNAFGLPSQEMLALVADEGSVR